MDVGKVTPVIQHGGGWGKRADPRLKASLCKTLLHNKKNHKSGLWSTGLSGMLKALSSISSTNQTKQDKNKSQPFNSLNAFSFPGFLSVFHTYYVSQCSRARTSLPTAAQHVPWVEEDHSHLDSVTQERCCGLSLRVSESSRIIGIHIK